MRINILTLFPEFFESPLSAGLMGKAVEKGIVEFGLVNPRDFATDRHKTVDDKPYGGGPGMVMFLGPMVAALESIPRRGRTIMLTPRGKPFTQAMARELAGEENLTLICGRYEGIDARLEELYPIESVSIGDYVLNGGEAGAMCVIEAVSRLVPDFMGKMASGDEESFSSGLLEYPHYTRPEEYDGLRVPEILTSGDHGRIAQWRRQEALRTTLAVRPDLLDEAHLDAKDIKFLRDLPRERLGRNLFIGLLHYPVLDKYKKVTAVSLTNLDLHDISRVSRSYGIMGMYAVTPLEDQKELAAQLVSHWSEGPGAKSNPHRAEAMRLVKIVDGLDDIIDDIAGQTGKTPRIVATSAQGAGNATPGGVREWLEEGPVLLLFGTSHGLAPEVMDRVDGTLRPIRCLSRYNHLSVRSAVSITVDRLLSDIY